MPVKNVNFNDFFHYQLGLNPPMMTHMKKELIALAANITDLAGCVPVEIQLTPAGTFKAKDGRPVGLTGWVLNNENAHAVVQLANSQTDAFVVDFEHQTLYAKQNGMPAPAAGWFSNLEYREGLGLFATKVEWTDSAALAIQNKEYRYISPVLSFEPKTGVVTKIHMAALTNNPALDSMKDLCALAADYFSPLKDSKMEEVEVLKAEIEALKTEIEALKAKKTEVVDLSNHVPVAAFQSLQQDFAALNSKISQNAVDDLVKSGLSDGRITPALAGWATSLSHEALSAFLDKTTPIAALSSTQTGDKPPVNEPKPELTPEEVAVCSAMGLSHDQFIETKGAN